MTRSAVTAGEGVVANQPWYVRVLASQTALGFNAGDANLYRYVGNDPVNGLDPSGLEEKKLPYPDKLGQCGPPIANKEADLIEQGGMAVGGGLLDRKGYINKYPGKEIKPKTIPKDKDVGATKPGNNIASGTHAFFGWPNQDGQFFGTGGCQGCVGVIIRCKGGYGAIFHFGAGDHPATTLMQYRDKCPKNGDCTAVVFGGDDTAFSRGLLQSAVNGLSMLIGWDNVYFADSDHLHIGANGEWYVRPPKK
jgi:uncharacterized protein RhaS with RHS repeats